ncbi:MAG: Nramp family divalent metal transporter [Bacteroidales bacterium]|nr:Nramp family divalent metal transporter [Bacteroidales bacterium]
MSTKKGHIKQRILNILFWSVISAAFIGPGTVTTATKAGVYFHYDLMWTMVFSIIACLFLQEASARIAIFSGMNLGEAIAKHFDGRSSKYLVLTVIMIAIVLGSAAYETGNILGSVEGLKFVFKKVPPRYFVLIIGAFAFIAFRLKSIRSIAQVLGSFVYLMGFAFLITAFFAKPDVSEILKGSFIPKIPDVPGAGMLILGIIGTTVVPYDLFLGSGIVDKTQTIKDARIGLSVAIILGGIISMSIMTVGSSITEGWSAEAIQNIDFNFDLMKDGLYLNSYINDYAVYIFGFGMFAAGLTSAITAPLASAITARNVFNKRPEKWTSNSLYFKLVTGGILLTGMIFGFLQVKPVPAIIVAQAFNGLILPFISIFMLIIINNPIVMGKRLNSHVSNGIMTFVVWITLLIGTINLAKATQSILGFEINQDLFFSVLAVLNLVVSLYILVKIYRFRRKKVAELAKNEDNNGRA